MSDSAVLPNITGTKRKSRFEDASASNSSAPPIATSLSGGDDQPPAKRMATGIDLSAAAAKAAAISREMASKVCLLECLLITYFQGFFSYPFSVL